MTERPNNMNKAVEIRRGLTRNAIEGRLFTQKVPAEIAALVFSLPTTALMSSSIRVEPLPTNNIGIAAIPKVQPEKPGVKTIDPLDLYMKLYKIIQATNLNHGRDLIEPKITKIIEELAKQDEVWIGLLESISHGNKMDENDLEIIHQKIFEIWQSLPEKVRNNLKSYQPSNLLSSIACT